MISNQQISVTGSSFYTNIQKPSIGSPSSAQLPPLVKVIENFSYSQVANQVAQSSIFLRNNDKFLIPKSLTQVKKKKSQSPNQQWRNIRKVAQQSKDYKSNNLDSNSFNRLISQNIQRFWQPKNLNMGNPKQIASQLANIYLSSGPQQNNQYLLTNTIMLIAHKVKFQNEEQEKQKQLKMQSPYQAREDQHYQYFLGSGNNVELIRRIFKKRVDWEESLLEKSPSINFKWQQGTKGYKYEHLIQNSQSKQLVNHFEHHRELSNKQFLLKNLTYFCENAKMNVFDFVPLTFVLDFDDDQVDIHLTNFLKYFNSNAPYASRILPELMQKKYFEIKRQLKVLICQNDRKQIFNFCKPKNLRTMTSDNDPYLWLLKPTFLNRGRGIHVFNNIDTITQLISDYQQGLEEKSFRKEKEKDCSSVKLTENENLSPDAKSIRSPLKLIPLKPQKSIIRANAFVVQKYIERPFLINQRKFDIRVWCLVTHELDCFFFKEGYIRTSSENYRTDQMENHFIHLTNNAVQQHSNNYGKFENGNQLSFSDFQSYLDKHSSGHNFKTKSINRIKELIWISLCSVRKKLNHEERKHCMEIFGYDFILDQDYNVWLIEVNTNPCIEESSPLLEMLLPRMIDDAFILTLDQIFCKREKGTRSGKNSEATETTQEPKVETERQSTYKVTGYTDSENMWDQMGNLNDNQKVNSYRRSLQPQNFYSVKL